MNCTETQELITSTGFLLVLSSQAVAGFLSAILSVIVTIKCGSLYFHINCRVLLTTLLLFYIVHSFFVSILQVVRYLQYPNSCNVGIAPGLCFWLRYPSATCMVSFSALQFAMVLERSVALWNREGYETYGPKLGLIFAAVSIITSTAFTTWAIRRSDFVHPSTYCTVATPTSAPRVTVLSFGICGLDLITLVAIITLYISNNIALKKNFSDLHTSYQLRENISVIRFILPLGISQTICYLIFSLSGGVLSLYRDHFLATTYRIAFAAVYIVPYYTVIAPILIWFIIKWSQQLKKSKLKTLQKQNRDEKEVYFRTYAYMWNTILPNKP